MKDNEKEEDDGYSEEDWLHRFFPVCGITLGETTIHEAENQEYLYAEIEYKDNGSVIVWTPDDQGRKGAQNRIEKEQNDDTFSNIYITRPEAMFNIWKSFGLDWSLSYNASVSLFKREGFTVYQIEKPHIYKSPNSGSEYFCSSIVAVADDYSIKFKLDFMGKKYESVNSRNTLYSVSAYSSNFCTNEGDEDFWNIEESREHIEPAILL